jgi:hypothetical protein
MKKILIARGLLSTAGYLPAVPLKLAADFQSLLLFSTEDQIEGLAASLREVTARDYSGAHPPEKSYEPGVRGDDLFAFAWTSEFFRRRMYFKFCLHKEAEDCFTLYVFSLHEEKRVRK